MPTIKCNGKPIANLEWFGHCEFSFPEKTQEVEGDEQLTLRIKIEPIKSQGKNMSVSDLDSIGHRLSQEGLDPWSEGVDESYWLFWIYSRKDIRKPGRYLKALAYKLSKEIEWDRDTSAAEEACRQADIDTYILIERNKEALSDQQFRDHFSTD